ncbi:MAG: hypothetical protein ACO3FT_07335 [Ilumatobacteraceae bacterium]
MRRGLAGLLALVVVACSTPLQPSLDDPLRLTRAVWFGFIEFTPDPTLPHTMRVVVDRTSPTPWLLFDGPPWVFVEGSPDGDWDSIRAHVHAARAATGRDVVAYLPATVHDRLPSDADLQGIEAYWRQTEDAAAFEARLTVAIRRAPRVVLIVQCYTSNATLISDLTRLPPVIVRLVNAHPHIEGLLLFSGAGRATGWTDHPEVHDAWWRVFLSMPPR